MIKRQELSPIKPSSHSITPFLSESCHRREQAIVTRDQLSALLPRWLSLRKPQHCPATQDPAGAATSTEHEWRPPSIERIKQKVFSATSSCRSDQCSDHQLPPIAARAVEY